MSAPWVIVGVDPGRVPGVCALHHTDGHLDARVFQCTHTAAVRLVTALLEEAEPVADVIVLAVERFVVGPRAARSSTPRAGQTTRDLIGALHELAREASVRVALRSAAETKPWATDRRLAAAGLFDPCKGMGHARDAARHALFAAVHDCGLPDPLSRRAS